HKVSRAQIRKSKDQGGLDFWHVKSKSNALKAEWVIKVVNEPLSELSKVVRAVTQTEIERADLDLNPFASLFGYYPKVLRCDTLRMLQEAWSRIVARRDEIRIGDVVVVLKENEDTDGTIKVETVTDTEVSGKTRDGRRRVVQRHYALQSSAQGK